MPVRKAPAILAAVAAVLAASLAGCAQSTPFGSCTSAYQPGDASSIVTVNGTVGSSPTATFPTPLIATGPQVSVVAPGTGDTIQRDSWVDVAYTVFQGSDAQNLGGAGYTAGNAPLFASTQQEHAPGLGSSDLPESMVCTRVGERYVLTGPVDEVFGDGVGAANNLAADATVAVVVDIKAAYLAKADGINQIVQDGMPNVVTAVDGTPAVSILTAKEPASLQVSTIKAGGGAAIADGDHVVVAFTAWAWPATGTTITSFTSTWPDGGPTQTPVVITPSDTSSAAIPIPASAKILVGQKVGSQILAVVPASAGYPSGAAPQGFPDGQTLIYVIDVLGIQK